MLWFSFSSLTKIQVILGWPTRVGCILVDRIQNLLFNLRDGVTVKHLDSMRLHILHAVLTNHLPHIDRLRIEIPR
jgi:hypothetical protein